MQRRAGQAISTHRRPPEPLRPLPAVRPGLSLLASKARRRRHRLRSGPARP